METVYEDDHEDDANNLDDESAEKEISERNANTFQNLGKTEWEIKFALITKIKALKRDNPYVAFDFVSRDMDLLSKSIQELGNCIHNMQEDIGVFQTREMTAACIDSAADFIGDKTGSIELAQTIKRDVHLKRIVTTYLETKGPIIQNVGYVFARALNICTIVYEKYYGPLSSPQLPPVPEGQSVSEADQSSS